MGDNRDCSKDSRYLDDVGYVQNLNLLGKAKMIFFSNDSNKNRYAEEIYTDIERYRSLVDVMINFEEGEFLETRMQEFNNYLDLFL